MEVTKKSTPKTASVKKKIPEFRRFSGVGVVWYEVFLFQVPIEVWPQKRGHVSGWES